MARKPAKTMNGKNESTSPITTPRGENKIMVMGSSINPIFIRNVFNSPYRPRIGRIAKTRTNSEIIKGRINSRITRCCATFGTRRRTNMAMGKPKTKEITTAQAEWIMEFR